MGKEEKTPIYKKWWFWVIIVLVLVAIGGGASQEASKVGTVENSTSNETSSTSTENSVFKVGDIIEKNNVRIAVTSVERNYSTGNEFTEPKDGKEFVKLNIKIENKSNDRVSYNALDWEIEDSNGNIESYMNAMFAQADDDIGSGDLAAGGVKSGSIVFEVPAGDTGLKAHYKDNIFSSSEIIINL